MIDRYTKTVLTVIALALVVLAARPLFEARSARAGDTMDVKIVGVGMDTHLIGGGALPVKCVSGCVR